MGFFSIFFPSQDSASPCKAPFMYGGQKGPQTQRPFRAFVEALKASTGQHREEHHQSLPPHHDHTQWACPPPSKVQDGKRTLGEDANILRWAVPKSCRSTLHGDGSAHTQSFKPGPQERSRWGTEQHSPVLKWRRRGFSIQQERAMPHYVARATGNSLWRLVWNTEIPRSLPQECWL